jgi:hypothetical protein
MECDQALDRLLRLPLEETIRNTNELLALIHPKDRAEFTQRAKRCAPEGADGLTIIDAMADEQEGCCDRPAVRLRCARLLPAQPDVLHAPAIKDAVDHDRHVLHLKPPAGAAAKVVDHRAHRILV